MSQNTSTTVERKCSFNAAKDQSIDLKRGASPLVAQK